MKKILIILLLITIICPVFSVESDANNTFAPFELPKGFCLSTSIGAGINFGMIKENYFEDITTSLYTISWLTWEMNYSSFVSINATIGYKTDSNHSFNVEGFFSYAYPSLTGVMEDFDALLYDKKITDFSHHDNFTDSFTTAGFYSDYISPIGLGAIIGFEYQSSKFSAKNGYAQHNSDYGITTGYWNPDMPITSTFDGFTVITYDSSSYYWKTGISYQYVLANRFLMGFDALINIYRYNKLLDKHYKFNPNVPNSYFTDIIETWFSGVEIRASFEFELSKHIAILFRTTGKYIPEEIGPDYFGKPPNQTLNEQYKGGFGAWIASNSLSVTFHL